MSLVDHKTLIDFSTAANSAMVNQYESIELHRIGEVSTVWKYLNLLHIKLDRRRQEDFKSSDQRIPIEFNHEEMVALDEQVCRNIYKLVLSTYVAAIPYEHIIMEIGDKFQVRSWLELLTQVIYLTNVNSSAPASLMQKFGKKCNRIWDISESQLEMNGKALLMTMKDIIPERGFSLRRQFVFSNFLADINDFLVTQTDDPVIDTEYEQRLSDSDSSVSSEVHTIDDMQVNTFINGPKDPVVEAKHSTESHIPSEIDDIFKLEQIESKFPGLKFLDMMRAKKLKSLQSKMRTGGKNLMSLIDLQERI